MMLCPDCKQEMTIETQVWKHKPQPTITHTCHTAGCGLNGAITLTAEQWALLTPGQIDQYRVANKQSTLAGQALANSRK